MATIKSLTSLEQSKKLAEILPHKSADMWYWEFPTAPTYNNYGYPMFHKGEDIRNVPCWSLVALLEVLPKGITLLKNSKDATYSVFSTDFENVDVKIQWHNNPVDACYEMIIKLHELKLL